MPMPAAPHGPGQALQVRQARTWKERLIGLLGTRGLPAGQALEIAPCNSVHTVGMRYAIDVVFLARDGRVLKVVHGLAPWRMAAAWRAARVLELAAGEARRLGIAAGQVWQPGAGRFAEAAPGVPQRAGPRR